MSLVGASPTLRLICGLFLLIPATMVMVGSPRYQSDCRQSPVWTWQPQIGPLLLRFLSGTSLPFPPTKPSRRCRSCWGPQDLLHFRRPLLALRHALLTGSRSFCSLLDLMLNHRLIRHI
ncbi:hypothetical protein B0J13DRAFT_3558 [Dactylonectria estremocensis]|uniref:Uncharacterized protein n=1 Tax=Dactylonectria estremocensis TaxID=1079267 RepID=A0A9P9FHG8_9HYPO|nr:hypothetical protein B0J13DRAFT_3558 [Dactylonectria estremocensis]